MSIQNELDKIKNAVYGKEVREAIHDSIEMTYNDSSVIHDNANMEVKLARGSALTLASRLAEMDNKDNQFTKEAKEITFEIESLKLSKRDNSVKIKSSDLDTSSDSLKIKPINISNELMTMFSPAGTVSPTIALGSIGTTHLAPLAVTSSRTTGSNKKLEVFGPYIYFDFELKTLTFTNVLFTWGTFKKMVTQTLSLEIIDARGYVLFDGETKTSRVSTFSTLNIGENEMIVCSFRTDSREVGLTTTFHIDGIKQNLPQSDNDINSVYLRNGVIKSTRLGNKMNVYISGVLPTIYVVLSNNSYSSTEIDEEFKNFELLHNEQLLYNRKNKTFRKKSFLVGVKETSEIVLLFNIDGLNVGGYLEIEPETIIGNYVENKEYSLSGYLWSDTTVIGNYICGFRPSDYDGLEVDVGAIYIFDKDMNFIKRLKHNFGHVNTVDYNKENGCLIFGNGSGFYDTDGEIIVISNFAPLLESENDAILNLHTLPDVTKIQLFKSMGDKLNVCWKKGNICFVISNDNKNIREVLLKKDTSGYTGEYTVLQEYILPEIDVNQGSCYYNGSLYVAMGHSGKWMVKYNLKSDGTFTINELKEQFYQDDGTLISSASEGVHIENGKIYHSVYGGIKKMFVYDVL